MLLKLIMLILEYKKRETIYSLIAIVFLSIEFPSHLIVFVK